MLLSEHWPYILFVASQRLKNNKTERHIESKDGCFEVQGAAGEILLRLYLGLEPKLHTTFDRGVDMWFRGWSIDNRGTKHREGGMGHLHLQWPQGKLVIAEYIALTAIDIPGQFGTVLGFATKAEMKRAPLNIYRERPCFEIGVAHLYEPQDLFKLEARDGYR